MIDLVRTLDRTCSPPAPPGELSVAFLDEPEMVSLHTRYFDDPTPTDVVTFPGDPAFGFAGEICVCFDQARQWSMQRDTGFSDELTLYLVHGYLHLAGYDDASPALQRTMRAAESRMMDVLRSENVLPAFFLAD